MITKKLLLAGIFSAAALFSTMSNATHSNQQNHANHINQATQQHPLSLQNHAPGVPHHAAQTVVKQVHYRQNGYQMQGHARPMPPRRVVVMNHRHHPRWFSRFHQRPLFGFYSGRR